jgi:hypothetical protein
MLTCGLLLGSASAQGVRVDSNVFTAATNVPVGAQAPMYTLPYARISICNAPSSGAPCNNYASVYSDQALTMQISQPLTADPQGRFGFWIAPGTYNYSVVTAAGTLAGTYYLNAATGGSSTPTYLTAGSGITITGSGTSGSPYVISVYTPPPSLTITSFTGGQTLEIGASVANPTFAASYSATPTSASIANTDGIGSPATCTTPFTSCVVSGTFSHNTNATTTFTLTASNGTSSPTATQQFQWLTRTFGGVGPDGATSTVTASGTTAVLSNSAVLATVNLGTSDIGNTYGPFTTSSNRVYLLLQGGAHTFIDPGTGFPFAMNSPVAVTFVNAQGVTVSMYLYESANDLIGTYSVKVAS